MFKIAQEYNIFDTITYTSLFGAIHFLPMATEHLVAPLLFHGNIPGVIHSLPPPPPYDYKVVACHSSPAPSNRACSWEIAASSFSHSSKTTIQYTAFFALFGFFLLNVFFDKDFLGEFWGLASFWIVPGFGKLSALISAVLPNFGLSDFKLSHDSLSDKLELVLALALLPRLSWPAFINLGLMGASRDCLRSMAPPLPKLFGGGPSWSKRTLLKSEESVLCRSSFWAVVGLRGSECLAIFCGCCMSATTLWILTRLFSSRRIKFFLARRSNLSSPSTWSAMFSTLIFTELRIWLKKDKITVQFTAEPVDKFYPWTILGRGNQYR